MAISPLQYDVYLGFRPTRNSSSRDLIISPSSRCLPCPCPALALPCPAGPIFAPDRPLSAHWLRLAALSSAPGPLFSSLSHSFCPHCLCQAHQFASWVKYFLQIAETRSSQPILSTLQKKEKTQLGTFPAHVPPLSAPSGAVLPAPLAGWTDRANVFATNSPHRRPSRQIRALLCPALPCLALCRVLAGCLVARPLCRPTYIIARVCLFSLFVTRMTSPVIRPAMCARQPVTWPARTQ